MMRERRKPGEGVGGGVKRKERDVWKEKKCQHQSYSLWKEKSL